MVNVSLDRLTANEAVVPVVPSIVFATPLAPITASTEKSATVSTDPSALMMVPPRTNVTPVAESA
jgi:hypothetical protein